MAAAVVVALELLVVMVDRVEEEMVVKEMLLLEVMGVPILVEVAEVVVVGVIQRVTKAMRFPL